MEIFLWQRQSKTEQQSCRRLFDNDHDIGAAGNCTRKTALQTGDLIYQFKVTILDIKPAVWRRIQVSDCTLAALHDYIQAAFGWCEEHLHEFEIDGERYGPPPPDDMDFGVDWIDET